MTRNPYFWDRIAEQYAALPIRFPDDYHHKLEQTRGRLTSHMRVLEFGCGTGSMAVRHAPLVADYVAIDVSFKMLEIAEKKRSAAGLANLQFMRDAIESRSLGRAHFDLVMGFSILHLVRDLDAVLHKLHTALKPGGLFISSTFCFADFDPLLRWMLPVTQRLGVTPAINQLAANGLRDTVQTAGFTIEEDWQPAPDRALFLIARKT
ncbi:SAM-dependent methyltransferase [Teredinibacter turnerae T7901]|uniref:SAM-dependent methyltransferase n=1 Tax=Teredinibacter turnerae (strain ATCC 39867 / T7901) TaxID=377629 RepID=C5BMU9_TERTT|nr:class I SAM-dependent methyltransferase [Teredinibacter turnerae]ACR13667.1 SAM-dependent methyltransferase [Teredinibacter turnerae T7901]